jgi:hypothetical protein
VKVQAKDGRLLIADVWGEPGYETVALIADDFSHVRFDTNHARALAKAIEAAADEIDARSVGG